MTCDPRHIRIDDYDYTLPEERIARYPVPGRDGSKLLVYRQGEVFHRPFTDLPELLPADSLMVFNNTKVIQARLHFRKDTGALIEIFCLEPHLPREYQQNFDSRGQCEWVCLVGNRKKWKQGALERVISRDGGDVTLRAEIVGPLQSGEVVCFTWDNPTLSFAEVLEAVGELPIPPYLNRDTEEQDKETYQTVYSKIEGSVAAPTAGLHFTERVFEALQRRGIVCDEITLHVGAGTFRPVKSEEMAGHEMHSEYIYVTRDSLQRLIDFQGRCTAVGTTSVRTLESLYYIGIKLLHQPDLTENQLHVDQWEPYDTAALPTTCEALEAIVDWLDRNRLSALHTSTQIIIAPGYTYHVVERMVTNFHMPKSTLLLLVSAFIGNDWRRAYDYALSHGFRFLSYGDSSLLMP